MYWQSASQADLASIGVAVAVVGVLVNGPAEQGGKTAAVNGIVVEVVAAVAAIGAVEATVAAAVAVAIAAEIVQASAYAAGLEPEVVE